MVPCISYHTRKFQGSSLSQYNGTTCVTKYLDIPIIVFSCRQHAKSFSMVRIDTRETVCLAISLRGVCRMSPVWWQRYGKSTHNLCETRAVQRGTNKCSDVVINVQGCFFSAILMPEIFGNSTLFMRDGALLRSSKNMFLVFAVGRT